ncbi:MAG: hypothetical protein KH024_17885 [Hungatella hathewayi]|nr:hypothetical protein [Hungatella hathewayi]
MSHFRLHTKWNGKERQNYLIMGAVCLLAVCGAGYAVHSFGIVSAKSREMVVIQTEDEFQQYLLDEESDGYNLNGRYQLDADLDLSWMETSVGTNVEPFTGSLDGNGHVITGLSRPLFGVLEGAEVENLFFSNAVIKNPVTYYDGEHYVDGYGALAAYAIRSSIRNCGVNGEIHTARPMETEYLLEKASPSEAEEFWGPGVLETTGVAGTLEEEKGTAGGNGAGGPGLETTAGPGAEIEHTDVTESEIDQEEQDAAQPSGEETSAVGQESSSTYPDGNENTSTDVAVEESGHDGGSGPAEIQPTETGGTAAKPTETGGEAAKPTEAGGEAAKPTEAGGEAAKPTEAGGAETKPAETGKVENQPVESGKVENETVETEGLGAEKAKSELVQAEAVSNPVNAKTAMAETVACRPVLRQMLMMKEATIINTGVEDLSEATPSDATEDGPSKATPSDAENIKEDTKHTTESQNSEEEFQYTGNPFGDICILVTADRITAGALIAETAEETLVSNCFALATISSDVEHVETYAGGLAGILGAGTRIENSYVSGLSDSTGVTGGFAAVNEGTIEDCYSTVTVGEQGTTRGAFTALGNGKLNGCVYDRQMACVSEEEALSEMEETPVATESEAGQEETYSLIGLNTVDMIGHEARIPGNWYTTEQAYPQLSYFAEQEAEMVTTGSKVSVIALILPDGCTLADAIKGEELLLPTQIDGQEINWAAEGDIRIDEHNYVRNGETQAVSE